MKTTHQRELLLLRHGKSSWESIESDFGRSLTEQGQQHVERIATYLQQNKLIPDFIVSSPATRALHTATIICHSLGIDPDTIHTDSQIYNARYEDLFSVIAQCPQRSYRVLLVGHNPSLEELVDVLDPKSNEHLSPATLVQLHSDNDWQHIQPSSARLISVTHGKSLAK